MLITTIPTYATTMCAINDTVAVVLDPSIGLTNRSSNNTTGTWWVWGPYGTVYGIGAILNDNKGFAYIRTVKHLHDTDNDGNDHLVTGGEKYGRYCWCRLTHPVSSLWAFATRIRVGVRLCFELHGRLRLLRPVLRRVARGLVWVGRAWRKLMWRKGRGP